LIYSVSDRPQEGTNPTKRRWKGGGKTSGSSRPRRKKVEGNFVSINLKRKNYAPTSKPGTGAGGGRKWGKGRFKRRGR
jgi:hypothetical protein